MAADPPRQGQGPEGNHNLEVRAPHYTKWSGVQFPPLPWFGDQLWLCGLIPHSAPVGVREYDGKVKKKRLQYI
jgi:hypothetical protein